MFGIPLMFMCLTYTGDLLADAFISVYSKMVNFFCRRLCCRRLIPWLANTPRPDFNESDVGKVIQSKLFSFILEILF